VNALPTATITPVTATTFCQGGSVILNASTGAGFMYQWYNNASPIGGATSSSYTANASGSYTVVVTNTSSCSATSSAANVLVNSNTTYFADSDNDGYGNLGSSTSACVQQTGYVLNSLDCNDANAAINTAAAEICNSIDDNCNSQTDEGLTFTLYYTDADGDGFGSGASNALCSSPGSGYSTNALDCNNLNASINPSATELCNNADDNCNSQIDEGLFFQNYYQDFDGDGFGFGSASSLCASQSGYVNNAFDCNDFQAQISPVAQETCNGIDDNCNTLADDGLQFSNYFLDGDQDGFGSGSPQSLCNNPGNGYSLVNTDCNDAIAAINPAATETCNSIDDNCNLQIDEGLVFTNYFADNDGDGFGSPAQAFPSCVPLNGMVTNNGDCNDANANINPNAEEIGGNGIDENCDGQIDNSILELNSTIALYPNPTHSELNIQINSSIIGNDLYIFDAVGKIVYKQQLLSTQTTIAVSNFADGNYIVRVGEVVKRFVVQK
jgi:predicted lactoylglutathione lyase